VPVPRPEIAPPSGEPRDETAITVVVVDDHRLVADGIAAALNIEEDITVLQIAETCGTAIDAVSTYKPDVLLLDQSLPDGLGTDIVQEVLALSPATKVLMVTADESDDVLIRAVVCGAGGVFPKGNPTVALVTAVRAVAHDEAIITPDELRRILPRLGRNGVRPGDQITPRELEVLRLLVTGASTASITAELVVSPATTRNHIQSIMSKLGAHSRLEAVAIAVREKILATPRPNSREHHW
jgi:DNA-binding NarL/FixJ family response regulator